MTNEPKKRGRPPKKDAPGSLKMVIGRTYSEGAKVNIGNYQSRDFFTSASRSVEIPWPATEEQQQQVSEALFLLVKEEVKAALKAEVDDASGTKPMQSAPRVEEAPSVPNAFDPAHKREVPWNKYVPRPVVEDDDMDLEP